MRIGNPFVHHRLFAQVIADNFIFAGLVDLVQVDVKDAAFAQLIVIKRKDGEHIGELVEILQKDPRFELYAAQFSQSASAPSGGKLGWVAAGQLAAPLDKVVRSLKEGQVSQAVPYRADYYIFKMDKIYNPVRDKQKMPDEDEVRTFIQNRKTDEMANKYIRDLRNRAVVEKKF